MYTFIREMSSKVNIFTGTAILTIAIVFLSETITVIYATFSGVTNLKVALVLPARSCIQAAKLPFDIKVEIDAIAYI